MKRLFVIDPVCGQTFGHNLSALHYFVNYAREGGQFDKVTGYCARPLIDTVDGTDIVAFFDFNYHNLFTIPPITTVDSLNVLSDRDYTKRSYLQFLSLMQQQGCTAEDSFFFPSADYYGIMGVLQAVQDHAASEAPKVILRMISVLESASRVKGTGYGNVVTLIRDCLAKGYPVEIVAETPAYARQLAVDLGCVVHVAPYPAIDDYSPLTDEMKPLVAVLGSGRYDKGFLRLKGIFTKVIDRVGTLPLSFVVQNLPNRDAMPFLKYTSELAAIPGLLLASDILPAEKLADYLHRARVVVMPYAQDVYATRGSAMLMEALSVGRPVVAEADCGFSAQIPYYECGTLCRSDDDYAEAIMQYVRMNTADLNARMIQARARFVFESNSAYERLW